MKPTLKALLFYTPLFIACAAQVARAQSTWGGGNVPAGNLNWSTAANWSSGGAPGSSSSVTFPDGNYPVTTNTLGGINNIIGGNQTVGSLFFNNISANNHYENTYIGIGTNLTVTGLITVGGTAIPSYAAFFGGGSLAGGGGSAALTVQSTTGTATMDLSGLTNFTFNAGSAGTVNLGTGSSSASGTLTLAAGSNNIVCNTLNLGNNNTGGTELMNAGNGTNNIFADTINLGVGKTKGTLQFFNNETGGLMIADHTGTGRAAINLSGPGGSGTSSAVFTGDMLFNGGTVNILASTMIVGNRGNRAVSGGNGSALGILSFNSGVVDATSIIVATNTGSAAPVIGTISVGGGTLKIGTGGMEIVYQGATMAATGTLIVTNGAAVTCSGNIFKGTSTGVATISISGSTLTMSSGSSTIGVNNGNTYPIDFFNVTNSTLTLAASGGIGQPSVATGNFNPDAATLTTVNIGSLPVISSYPDVFQMISYTNAAVNLNNVVLGTLPALFKGYISNDTANASIDLVLTNGPASKQDTWSGAVNSLWDTTTHNWISSGVATNYNDLDQVTFDDSCVNSNVTITAARTPASVSGLTFNNSSKNYVLSGGGKITGPAGLNITGSATNTLSDSGGDNFSGGITVGNGTLILDDANSAISGGLSINNGTVQIGNNDGNGVLPAGTLNDSGTLVFDRSNALTVSIAIPGSGNVTQIGTNTLTFSNTNSYSGVTTVNAGTLALTGSGLLSSSSSVIVSNATLDVSGVTANADVTTLQNLNLTNAYLNVEVSYIQTNLNITGNLNLGGPTNVINVKSLPAIAYYPATNMLLYASSGIIGYNYLGLGTLPAATPAYAGSITESADGDSVLLVLTAGPTNSRPSVTWSGVDELNAVSTNWSDALNWQTPGVPVATEPVVFNDTASVGSSALSTPGGGISDLVPANIDNIVNVSLTNASLNYANTSTGSGWHNTQIASGKTLTINGSVTVNGSGGNVTILGTGGALQVNDPANNNTFNVEAGSVPTLDMSGLDNFNANVNQIGTGYNLSSGALAYGTWYLAKTNIISTGSGSSGASAAWVIGGTPSQSASGNGQVYLGQTNAIYVDGIAMGLGSASVNSLFEFNPNLAGSNPFAYIRGITGSSSRVTAWTLGDDTVNINNATDGYGQICDFSIGTLNALVGTLIIGQGDQGNTALGSGNVTGTFNMGAGNLNVLTLNIGASDNGKTGGAGVGVMNVTGGTVVAGSLNLAVGTVAGTSGALNLTNATLVVSNGITIGTGNGGGTLSASNSTVELLGGTIGTTAAPLSTLNLNGGGAFQFNVDGNNAVGNANVADITAATVNTNGTTIINIAAAANVGGTMQIPLLSYNPSDTTADPYGALSLGTYPVGYTVSLVDDTANSSVDLSIVPSGLYIFSASATPSSATRFQSRVLSVTVTNGDPFFTITVNASSVNNGPNPLTLVRDAAEPAGIYIYTNTLALTGATNGNYTLPVNVTDSMNNMVNGSIAFTVVGTTLTWNGDSSGNSYWDTSGEIEWQGGEAYQNGDFVRFDDTAAANPNVTNIDLEPTLTPASVTVSNTATLPTGIYTFGGTGSISGAISLLKQGSGTLVLSNVDTFTGGANLNGGTVVAYTSSLGSSGTISFGGGTLEYGVSSSATNTTDYSPRFSTAASQTNNINVPAYPNNSSPYGSIIVTYSSPMTSSGGILTKTGGGELELAATNTFSAINLSGGMVRANNTNSFGIITAPITITETSPGTEIYFSVAGTYSNSLSIQGFGAPEADPDVTSLGAIRIGASSVNLAGEITLTGNAGISPRSANPGIISGQITGNYGIQFGRTSTSSGAGSGMLILSNVLNNWTGDTTLADGFLKLGASGVIPSGSGYGNMVMTNAGTTFNAGITNTFFDLNGFSQSINGLSNAIGVTGSTLNKLWVTNDGPSAVTLTLGKNNANGNFGGIIGNGANALSLTKTGTGTQTLSGANTYTGSTTVGGGTLITTTASTGQGSYAVTNAAVLDVQVASAGAQLTMGGLTMGNSSSDASTLQIDTLATGNPTVAPVIAGTITTNGTVNIKLSGTALAAGTFPLISYSGASPSGALHFIPPAGFTGSLSDNLSGLISVTIAVASSSPPVITGISVSGHTLTISATNGADSGPYTLFETTNLLPPIVWTPVFTNSFSGTGTINLSTNVVNPATPHEFYLLEEP